MTSSAHDLGHLIRAPRRRVPVGVIGAVVHAGATALCIWAWSVGWWPLSVALWPLIIWMNHAALTLLHEAGHGMLAPVRWVNEAHGGLIGTASLIPLSVYRYVHARHHAHLGGPRDPEFWPYNLPCSSRFVRVTYAWVELIAGWIVTPLLYSIRTAQSWSLVPRRQRRRILLEWGILIAAWAAVLWLITTMGWWTGFTVGFLIPAWGAGTFQTIRKFTEHLGMHGDSIFTMTRTVVYRGPLGRAASRSQLHVDHHATHHRYARIPFYELPQATEIICERSEPTPTFSSHAAAVRDMLPHLLDPKVGPQWRGGDR